MLVQRMAITLIIFLSCLALALGDGTSTHQDALKTIRIEDGDLFKCIDINQQPTLSHPLLKSHKVQMKPSSYPYELHNRSLPLATNSLAQLPTISCPRGTVPILQNSKGGIKKIEGFHKMEDPHGEVWPSYSGDNFARFHITWRDNTLDSMCFDHDCPGFVQVNPRIALGSRIQQVSVYNGPQHFIDVLLFKNPKTKDWWVALGGTPIGYWPSSIFSHLKDKVTEAALGGHVYGPTAQSYFPEMGSGHFSSEWFGKAAYVSNIKIVDENNNYFTPDTEKTFATSTKPRCYTVDNFGQDEGGMHVYYGGPVGCKN